MKVLVTGATGHIGNVLVRQLVENGDDVRVLIPPFENDLPIKELDVDRVPGDVCHMNSLVGAFKGIDTVYHLAGIISISPGHNELLQRVNVGGTKNVAEACMKSGVNRLVYTSSIHALNEPPHGIFIDETCNFDPDNVPRGYARCKAQASLEVKSAVRRGLDAVIVCPTGVIGPYDFKISEMGQLILDFIHGKLKAYIDGAYDFADVRDVARGIRLAGKKGRKGEVYILSGEQVTVPQLMKILEEATGVKAPSFKLPSWLARTVGMVAPLYYRLIKSKPLFTTYSVDVLGSNSLVTSEKARCELGYTTRPATESIADSVAWFISNFKHMQLAPLY